MRKNTLYRYLAAVLIVIFLVSICYLISYQVVKMQYSRGLTEESGSSEGLAASLFEGLRLGMYHYQEKQEQIKDAALNGQEETTGSDTDGQALMTTAGNITIQAETTYILEVYDQERDYLSKHELNPPSYLIGLNRMDLEQYVADYMEHVPLDEFQMGLLSYEIVSFSGEKVVLRKVYDQSTVPYQYYLVIERGYLVVYYADQKTVYEYTGIEASELPEEEQVKLAYGLFLKDQSELYGLLQGYSS